jgi:hypothetical protein
MTVANAQKARQFDQAFVLLAALGGPRRPVTEPGDCPGYGEELPESWVCQNRCPLAAPCYAALEAQREIGK